MKIMKTWLRMMARRAIMVIFMLILALGAFSGNIKLVALLFVLAIMVPFEIFLICRYRRDIALKYRCSKTTKGVISHVSKTMKVSDPVRGMDVKDNEYVYFATVQYNVGGKAYTAETTYYGYAYVGQRENVHYNPHNPSDCHVGGGMTAAVVASWLAIIVFLIIICFLLSIAFGAF